MDKRWDIRHNDNDYTFYFKYTLQQVPDQWGIIINGIEGSLDEFYQLARTIGPEDLVVFYNKRNDRVSDRVRGYNKRSLFDM